MSCMLTYADCLSEQNADLPSSQRIGILATLERERRELENTNQDFLLDNLRTMFDNAKQPFEPFIDSQIKAIDNVKVKTNKRRGLMSFARRLPNFVTAIENTLPQVEVNNARSIRNSRSSEALREPYPETRAIVDAGYERISAAIFRNLLDIARATGPANSAVADPEDKERLNHEILLIENMYYIARNLDPGASAIMQAWRSKANDKMLERREEYAKAVVRRPLGRLLDFMDTMSSGNGRTQEPGQGRAAFKRGLGGYDSKTCRRDVEALKKRVEKHFTPPQEGQAGGSETAATKNHKLIGEILDVCQEKFEDCIGRMELMAREYEPPVEIGITEEQVQDAWQH